MRELLAITNTVREIASYREPPNDIIQLIRLGAVFEKIPKLDSAGA